MSIGDEFENTLATDHSLLAHRDQGCLLTSRVSRDAAQQLQVGLLPPVRWSSIFEDSEIE